MPRGLAAAAFLITMAVASAATSAAPTVTISGRAYAFNHSDTGLAGAVIRVRELPGVSAVADAKGDYELEVPDDTNVTPYIEPPDGYNQIDLQTFHTRGKPLENVNFQTPADAEYNGLAALLDVPLGPDGRPEQCVIVTTASARNVRGVDFETFQERTPHGVAGATAHGKPALPQPIYFNDQVIPDRSRPETSGDGGIIWTEVPSGTYRVITEHRSTRFASFLATCGPGRIVNANPPWGAYELTGKEKPLGAGIVAGSPKGVHVSPRGSMSLRIDAAEPLKVTATLFRGGQRSGPRQTERVNIGRNDLGFFFTRPLKPGRGRIELELSDKAGDSVVNEFKYRFPRK